MAELVGVNEGYVYQPNATKDRKSNMRNPRKIQNSRYFLNRPHMWRAALFDTEIAWQPTETTAACFNLKLVTSSEVFSCTFHKMLDCNVMSVILTRFIFNNKQMCFTYIVSVRENRWVACLHFILDVCAELFEVFVLCNFVIFTACWGEMSWNFAQFSYPTETQHLNDFAWTSQ